MPAIPVTILTGFLGSGKTTLLNRLLSGEAGADTAVIINEFGEIPLDHLLVEQAIENTVTLQSGCICCTIRGDLVDTLIDLAGKRDRGEVPAFARVVVETTGLAEPGPIIQTLVEDGAVTPRFGLRGVVATVDAVNGLAQLGRYAEAAKQVAAAGLLLVTKTDLADAVTVAALTAALREMNPLAQVQTAIAGDVPAAAVFSGPEWDPEHDVRAWLPSGIAARASPTRTLDGHAGRLRYGDGPAVEAVSLSLDAPMSEAALALWLDAIVSLRGADILRLKALVNLEGHAGPTVVQGVQHLVHPARELAAWPDGNPQTRIVLIGNGLPAAGLRACLNAAMAAYPVAEAA